MRRTDTHADLMAALMVVVVIMIGSFLGTLGAGLILRAAL